jgi:uncharacterized membrane protein
MSEGEKKFPWRTLAVVSLAVNMLFVGAGIGFVASGAYLRRPTAVMMRGGGPMGDLPPERRKVLMHDMFDAWRSGEEERKAANAARENVLTVAAREPYDEKAMREAMAGLRGADQAVLTHYHDTIIKTLAKLDARERVAVLSAAPGFSMRRWGPGHPGQGGGMRPPFGPGGMGPGGFGAGPDLPPPPDGGPDGPPPPERPKSP